MTQDGFHLGKTLEVYFQREEELGAYESKTRELVSGNFEVKIYTPNENGRVVAVSPNPRPLHHDLFDISANAIITLMRSMYPNSNVQIQSEGGAFSHYEKEREMGVESKEFEDSVREDLGKSSKVYEYNINRLNEDGSAYPIFSLRRSAAAGSAIFDVARLFGTNQEIVEAAKTLDDVLATETVISE